jgi:hypothetical protein
MERPYSFVEAIERPLARVHLIWWIIEMITAVPSAFFSGLWAKASGFPPLLVALTALGGLATASAVVALLYVLWAQFRRSIERSSKGSLDTRDIIITITYPANEGVLEDGRPDKKNGVLTGGLIYPVRGTITHLPADHEIWILHEGFPSREIWPQGKAVITWRDIEQSKWEGHTFLWKTQDRVTIIAVAAPPSSSQTFEHYYKVEKNVLKNIFR